MNIIKKPLDLMVSILEMIYQMKLKKEICDKFR